MTALKVRLPDTTAEKLDELAEKLDRSVGEVVQLAIEDYVARQAWQVAEIEAGLAEADAGDFADSAEVKSVMAKFATNARQI